MSLLVTQRWRVRAEPSAALYFENNELRKRVAELEDTLRNTDFKETSLDDESSADLSREELARRVVELSQKLTDAESSLTSAREESVASLSKASAAEALARSLDALNDELKQKVLSLEYQLLAAATSAVASEPPSQPSSSKASSSSLAFVSRAAMLQHDLDAARTDLAEEQDELSAEETEEYEAAATLAATSAEDAHRAAEERCKVAEAAAAVEAAAAEVERVKGATADDDVGAGTTSSDIREPVSLEGLQTAEAAALIWAKLREFAREHGSLRSLDLFRKLDADRSGALDVKEFKAALASCGMPGAISTKVVKAVMKHAGLNAKGSGVPYGAFVAALTATSPH
jgi:hypothetical protein